MNRLIYHLVAFLVVAVWGSTFVFTKLLLIAGLTAAQIFVLRFIVTGGSLYFLMGTILILTGMYLSCRRHTPYSTG